MMPDTIFSPSFGNRPSTLVGRQEVLRAMAASLASRPGSRERASLLLGQRGSGKTVLLWELADVARKQGFVVANPTTASEGMLDRIVEKVQSDGERFETRGPASVSGASLGALGFSVGLQFTRDTLETKSFHFKLRSLCVKLSRLDHGVLILVDELQANTADLRQLVGAYQELVGEGFNVALILAGLPSAVSGMLNDKVLTFLNRAQRVALDPLPLGEIDAYYVAAFRQLGIEVADELRAEAVRATEGSPYLMQLVGHYLCLYACDGMVGQTDLLRAVDAARSDFKRDVCETTLASLSEKDIAFLRAMTADTDVSTVAEVAERMGVSRDYAQKYRRRLIDSGVIEVAGRGHVRFAVPYLHAWLREREG